MAKTIATSKYACISNDEVTSVFMGKDLPEYDAAVLELIKIDGLSPEPQLGWGYDKTTKVFSKPHGAATPTFQQEFDAKSLEIKNARGVYLLPSGIEYMGKVFDLNQDTYRNITSAAAVVSLLGVLPTSFAWIAQDNTAVPMTLEQFKGFVTLVAMRFHDGYAKSATQKSILAKAKTIDQVRAVSV